MLPFGIGFGEIVMIFLVLLLVVGPEGIPTAIRSIAKVIRSLRRFVDDVRYSEEFTEVKRELLDPINEARRFNPQARAREWVKNEIETPVRSSVAEMTQPEPRNPNPESVVHHHDHHDDELEHEVEDELDDELEDELGLVSAVDPLERGLQMGELQKGSDRLNDHP